MPCGNYRKNNNQGAKTRSLIGKLCFFGPWLFNSSVGGQLAAARGNVDAPALAHGAGQFIFRQDILKPPRGGAIRRSTVIARGRIEGDQVYLGAQAMEQTTDRVRLRRRIVPAGNQRPLEKDPALLFFRRRYWRSGCGQ